MKAIIVKYHPWTNTKAAYMKATDGDNSIKIPIDDDLTSDENYRKAAEMLCKKMGWNDVNLIQGSLKNEEVFVMVPMKKCNKCGEYESIVNHCACWMNE